MRRLWPWRRWPAAVVFVMLAFGTVANQAPAAEAQPAEDSWADWDPISKELFGACRALVEWMANGSEGDSPLGWQFDPIQGLFLLSADPEHPDVIDQIEDNDEQSRYIDLWDDAIDVGYFTSMHWDDNYTWRPKCHTLLPQPYVSRVSIQYWSETYSRCLDNVDGGQTHRRPEVVPAWYWELSMEYGDCSLLLPMSAFGLEGDDSTAWSAWSEDGESALPYDEADQYLKDAYDLCIEYIGWRMDAGAAGVGDLGPKYWDGPLVDDPPRLAVPRRVWLEALDFFEDPTIEDNSASAENTMPAEWLPKCDMLLLFTSCEPDNANESLVPEQCLGPAATANYDIGFDEHDPPDITGEDDGDISISRNLWGGLTSFVYQLGKGAIQVALWSVNWAYTFDISKYNPLAIEVGEKYQTNLLDHDGFRLDELLWLALFAWAGYVALRGRLAMASSEIVVTVLLLLLSGVLLHQRELYMSSTWELMDKASNTLLVAGMGDDPEQLEEDEEGEIEGAEDELSDQATRDEIIRSLQEEIHFVFVEQSYDYLNWGQSLGDADDTSNPLRQCAATRQWILSLGPHGTSDWPRQEMYAAGDGECKGLAEYNQDPDGTRLLGGVLVMVSAITVSVLLIVTGLTIIVAKLIALLLFAVAPLAALVVILPGSGRRLAWSWVTTVMQVVLAVIGMSFMLSLLLLTLAGLVEMTGDVAMIERFALLNLIVVVIMVARRSLLASGRSFAVRAREHLTSLRGRGDNGWASAPAAHEGGGLNLLSVDRGARNVAIGPLWVAGTQIAMRTSERRVQRRNYKNLVNVSRWKRKENTLNARWRAGWAARNPTRTPLEIPVKRQPLP